MPNANGVQNAALAAAAIAAAAASNSTTSSGDVARLASLALGGGGGAAPIASLPIGVPPPPLVTVSGETPTGAGDARAPTTAPLASTTSTMLGGVGGGVGGGVATASSADPSPRAPASRVRKSNNKRKVGAARVAFAAAHRRSFRRRPRNSPTRSSIAKWPKRSRRSRAKRPS